MPRTSPFSAPATLADRVPPHLYFVVSAVFHYLGPAFAVMLFAHIAPLGYVFAFANCALFVAYIVLGHRIAGSGGIDRLGLSMLIAMAAALPVGIGQALPAFTDLKLLGAAIGVGVTSSVIPYVTDQLAMARLPRATFAILLSILPASATAIGFLVLRQVPTWVELLGIGLVIAGIALHRAQQSG